jgi:hypothetical protein
MFLLSYRRLPFPLPSLRSFLYVRRQSAIMLIILRIALFATLSQSLLHHLIVGTINGQALYSLEMDDQARTVHYIQARDASGASPSLVLDVRSHHAASCYIAN